MKNRSYIYQPVAYCLFKKSTSYGIDLILISAGHFISAEFLKNGFVHAKYPTSVMFVMGVMYTSLINDQESTQRILPRNFLKVFRTKIYLFFEKSFKTNAKNKRDQLYQRSSTCIYLIYALFFVHKDCCMGIIPFQHETFISPSGIFSLALAKPLARNIPV